MTLVSLENLRSLRGYNFVITDGRELNQIKLDISILTNRFLLSTLFKVTIVTTALTEGTDAAIGIMVMLRNRNKCVTYFLSLVSFLILDMVCSYKHK